MSKLMTLDLEAAGLTAAELEMAQGILKSDGSLRASKPKNVSGETKYIWRMVAFSLSDRPAHHCLPVMAEFDLDKEYFRSREGHERRRELTKHLNSIADRIVNTVPVLQQPGTRRWATVFGVI